MASALEALYMLAAAPLQVTALQDGEDTINDDAAVWQELLLLRRRCDEVSLWRCVLCEGTAYQAALAGGVERIQAQFAARLAELELTIVEDPQLTSYHIRFELREFVAIFQRLHHVLHQTVGNDLRGGPLLALLHESAVDGDPVIRAAFKSLLHAVHLPFFADLIRWLAFGEVSAAAAAGSVGDFFIQLRGWGGAPPPGEPERRGGRVRLVACASAGEGPGGGEAAPQHQPALPGIFACAANEDEWMSGCTLEHGAVPLRHMSLAVARSILWIGKVVRLEMRRGQSSADAAADVAAQVLPDPRLAVPPAGRQPTDRPVSSSVVFPAAEGGEWTASAAAADAPRHSAAAPAVVDLESSLLRDRLAVAHLLMSLRSAPAFDSLAFEVVIERIKQAANRRLWLMLAGDGLLQRHVQGMRDFLLCGRGDLFQTLLEGALPLMAALPPASPHAIDALTRGPWASALEAAFPPLAGPGSTRSLPVHDYEAHHPLERVPSAARRASSSSSDSRAAGPPSAGTASSRRHDATAPGAVRPAAGLPTQWGREDALAARRGTHASLFPSSPGERGAAHTAAADHLSMTAASAALPGPAADSWGEAGNERAMQFLQHCALHMPPRAQAWFAPSGGGEAQFRHWCPSRGMAPDRVSRLQRVAAGVVLVGAAARGEGAGDGWDAAHPLAPTTSSAATYLALSEKRAAAGAVWLPSPVAVVNGFLLRANTRLHLASPGLPAAEGEGPFAHTASFAMVLHRGQLLACGEPATDDSGAKAGALGTSRPPGAGYRGLPESLVVHILCKRLPPAASAPSPPHVPALLAPGRFRVVAAVYGRPGSAAAAAGAVVPDVEPDQRALLASGAALEHELPCEGAAAEGAAVAYALHVCLEYLPQGAVAPGGAAAAVGTGQLRVSIAGRPWGAPSQQPLLLEAAAAGAGVCLLAAPLRLEDALSFAGWSGPGRGRAWVGLCSEMAGAPATAGSRPPTLPFLPSVSLQALDAAAYAEGKDGYQGLTLAYAPPWPLHVLLDSNALGVYSDIGRFLMRSKAQALGLQLAWKSLSESATLDALEVAPSSRPASAGVSAQLSGVGGKRPTDAGLIARAAAKLALSRSLLPVWLLRSRMAFLVDALLYHLQVDVIAASHAAFAASAASSREYGELARAHSLYMHALVTGSFLSQPSLLTIVERCLGHVDAFLLLAPLRHGGGGSHAGRGLGQAELRARSAPLGDAFLADVRFLCLALREGPGAGREGLLSRLSFNGFFAWGT